MAFDGIWGKAFGRSVTGRLGSVRRAVGALALAGVVLSGGCSVKTDFKDVDVEVSEEEIRAALRKLFPELTDAEITRFSAKLDWTALLELKLEVEALRLIADTLSKELDETSKDLFPSRADRLASHNGGFPEGLEPVGRAAFYDSAAKEARIELSGVFENRTSITLDDGQVSVSVNGALQDVTLQCAGQEPVDIVLLVDITGSMRSVIRSVRRSLLTFVQALAEHEVNGTVSVITFQDSVGVNVGFQERRPSSGYERSPFATPVAIDDEEAMAELERFIARLEADSGADRPENLAGAIDFARNNVIGVTSSGAPNVIGDGVSDPAGVKPWPGFENERQIFVAFTDAPFHGDSRTPSNSSLKAPFKPRPAAAILETLQQSKTVVHVSDPSWVDETTTTSATFVDADYWATHTGGLGEDRVAGYSLVDLDLVVHSESTGLLDILLDGIVASSCTVTVPNLSVGANAELSLDLELDVEGSVFAETLTAVKL